MITSGRDPSLWPLGGDELASKNPPIGSIWFEEEGDLVIAASRLIAIDEKGYVWEPIAVPPGGLPPAVFFGPDIRYLGGEDE